MLLGAETLAVLLTFWALATVDGASGWASVLLGWALLYLALVDLRCFRLPDAVTLPLVLAGLGLSVLGLTGPLLDHALGALVGFAVLAALRSIWLTWRGVEGLGLGDAKLLAAAGAWTGVAALPSVMLIACAAAFVHVAVLMRTGTTARRDLALPFGPALCIGFWITWLHGPVVLRGHGFVTNLL